MGSGFVLLFRNFQVRSLQGIVVRFIQIPKQKGPDSTRLSALGENLHLYDLRAKGVKIQKVMMPALHSDWRSSSVQDLKSTRHLKSRPSGSASLYSLYS